MDVDASKFMNKIQSLVLLILTITPWPISFYFSYQGRQLFLQDPISYEEISAHSAKMGTVSLFVLLWILGLIIFYLIYLFRSSGVSNLDDRLLWSFGIIMFNVIAMPIFWYRNIWKASNDLKTE